jgi:hypothetical protein
VLKLKGDNTDKTTWVIEWNGKEYQDPFAFAIDGQMGKDEKILSVVK